MEETVEFPIDLIVRAVTEGVNMLIEYGKFDTAMDFIKQFEECGNYVNDQEFYLSKLESILKELEVQLVECLN